MQEGTVLRRRNRYTQAYSTKFGWSRVHTTKRKGDVHETLSLFFKRSGGLPKMAMDVSKEKTLGLFMNKCQKADFHIKRTELYSLWHLQAEENIREPKKGAVRKMVW